MDATPTRVDERALAAGTTARFVLLVALLAMSSCLMILYVATFLSTHDGFRCSLAAGVDPVLDSVHALVAKRSMQWEAYYACTLRYATAPPLWVPLTWLLSLAVLTAALFWAIPRWKSRRVVPLAEVDKKLDKNGEIRGVLDELTREAGLARAPRFVVDPAAMSVNAVVYGSNRRPVVCLHGGLLVHRSTAPQTFRAVVLHELGHIHNRDITLTYLTIALWRVYAAVALPPFLVWCGVKFAYADGSPLWVSEAPMVTRAVLLAVVMTVFVYLARADVLRSREIYADLAAVRWGASPDGWLTTSAFQGGRLRWIKDLLRIHPGPSERRRALLDPEVLFGLRPLPIVLTGAAALVFSNQIVYVLTLYVQLKWWNQYVAAAVAAALVVGVVGVALWRAVVHAVLTGRRVPTGIRAGLWLGLGLVLGGAIAGQGTTTVWLPDRPHALALVVLAAVAFTCWTTRCALLWLSAWQGRTLRPVLLLSLAAATLVLASWFTWWQTQGVGFTTGITINFAGVRNVLVADYTGQATDNPPLSAWDRPFTLTQMVIGSLTSPPPAFAALAGLWCVPLLAWLARPTGRLPRWARNAAPDLDENAAVGTALPTLRSVLLPGLTGGFVGSLAVVGASAHLHANHFTEPSVVRYVTASVSWTVLALVAGGATAAVVACARVRAHRLFAALIASQTATLVGFLTLYLRAAFEGCVPAISTIRATCGWHPWSTSPLFRYYLIPAVVLGVVVAVIVAAAAALLSRRDTPRPEVRGMAIRRLAVAALCLVAFGLGVIRAIQLSPAASVIPAAADIQRHARQWWDTAESAGPPSAETVALQVRAWDNSGGDDLMDRFYDDRRYAFATVTAYVNNGKRGVSGLDAVGPLCADISGVAKDAARYFRVPDPDTQRLWEKFIAQAWQSAQACGISLDRQDSAGFDDAMKKLGAAQKTAYQIEDRIDALIEAGK